MKRFLLIAFCVTFIAAFGATQVLADAYQVTANFGVRVTEQGTDERVGSITLAPNEAGTDIFDSVTGGGQIITVELLGNATLSRTFGATYDYATHTLITAYDPTVAADPADGDYTVFGVAGQDYVTIAIHVDSAAAQTVVIGHDDASALCYNLQGTVYSAGDPSLQLVQNSYRDNLNSTFSGDIYVATVKPKSIIFGACGKAGTLIDILVPDGTLAQGEDCGLGTGSACLFTFTDTGAGTLTGDYEFVVGKATSPKLGVEITAVMIEKYDPTDPAADAEGWVDLGATIPAQGTLVTASVTLTGPGEYRLSINYEFDTCTIEAGLWTVDVYASLDPCGGSFANADVEAVQFVWPTGIPTTAVLPYAAGSTGPWFNGLVLTNPSAVAVTITCTMVEEDGDSFTGSVTVPANQMVVGLAETVLNPTAVDSDATLGDESYAIYLSGDGQFYAFLFIGDGTMAQGYLAVNPNLQFLLDVD